MDSGVYEITNVINNKKYIGSTANIARRLNEHKYNLAKQQHVNSHLQSAWNKYGKESFTFKSLLYCDLEMVLIYEQLCLDKLHPEYNMTIVAGSTLGNKMSIEAKEKISRAMKGRKHSDEHRNNISKGRKGIVFSEEHKKHLREARAEMVLSGVKSTGGVHKGSKFTEEHKKKIGDALRGRIFINRKCKNTDIQLEQTN